jgi:hypothetical protein
MTVMTTMSTQIQQPKLTECNRCRANGFPGQMITFQQSTTRKKPDGKPFWILLNGDLSDHEHILPQSTGMQSIRNIEDNRPLSRPSMTDTKLELTQDEIVCLKQFVLMLKRIGN